MQLNKITPEYLKAYTLGLEIAKEFEANPSKTLKKYDHHEGEGHTISNVLITKDALDKQIIQISVQLDNFAWLNIKEEFDQETNFGIFETQAYLKVYYENDKDYECIEFKLEDNLFGNIQDFYDLLNKLKSIKLYE